MLRTFDQHHIRETRSLDGRWAFTTAGDRKDNKALPDTYARTIQVPSAWEMLPGLENYRGTGWLRRTFETNGKGHIRLVFGGVSHTGTVFVDGQKLGSHYDAFTPWAVIAKGLQAGPHELVVEVDNSFGDHSALHKENDYMTYGGITRPVELHEVPDVYIDNVQATPRQRGKTWSLDVCVRLQNIASKQAERTVTVSVAGKELSLGSVKVGSGKTVMISGTIASLSVKPWTATTPELYILQTRLLEGQTPVDDLIDRVGFREMKVRGKKILLNGKSVRLRGYNRHEDHPQFGNALPMEAMVADLELMRDLNINTVRTSHYPNDMRFLDLCDEMGFMVWEESHARTIKFDHPKYREQIDNSTTDMVEWHFNHPSIVIWGCLNECDSKTSSGKKEHARVLKLLKQLDPSRPTTFASNKRMDDVCLGLVDIVSWNIYTGWLGEDAKQTETVINELLRWLDSSKSGGGKGKPVIISEFGAGAIYGYRHRRRRHWTEEFQREVLDETLKVYLNHPQIAGSLIRQFCDSRVDEGRFCAHPRTMNNKGTVDEYRRPKLAYDVVKKRMQEAAEKCDN